MKNLKTFLIVVIVVLTGTTIWFVYTADYKYTNDKAALQQAIDDMSIRTRAGLNVEILEIAETEQGAIAFVRQRLTIREENSQSLGFVRFERGPNRRYRVESHWMEQFIPYSNFVMASTFFENPWGHVFLDPRADVAIGGFEVGEAHKFGIRFTHDSAFIEDVETDEFQRYFIGEVLFPIENENFVKEITLEELLERVEFAEEFESFVHNARVYPVASLYDDTGIEITQRFAISGRSQGSGGRSIPLAVNTERIFFILFVGATLIGLVIKPPVRNRTLKKQQSQDANASN
jgi:hypothetical protein